MSELDADVIVVGAGPAGLCVAGELHRRGVSVIVLEERTDPSPGTRAIGIHPPTLAALEPSGLTERLLAEAARVTVGKAVTAGREIGEVRFDRLATRFPFVVTVPQARTEAALAALAPEVLRGERVIDIREEGQQVRLETQDRTFRARGVVVASGARGRALAGVPIRTRPFRDRYLMADIGAGSAQPADTAVVTLARDGVLESFPLPDGGRRLVAWDNASVSFQERGDQRSRLVAAVRDRTGDFAAAELIDVVTSFGIRTVLAQRMRAGRVWSIGDAAHEVSPIGGQGMNLGLLDAAMLAPALAAWLRDETDDRDLHRWEVARLASARTAARLAGVNTTLGRPRAAVPHRAMAAVVALALGGGGGSVAARAYAMGLDRSRQISRKPRR